MRPASELERRRLNALFADLCAIPSPSGDEAACAQRVTAELAGMGLRAERDAKGNLLGRAGAPGSAAILLCAHLDTVPPTAPIDPVVTGDGWENRHDGILGADNKAAVAVMLEVVRRVAVEGAPVAVELLLTVEEEVALAGAKAFDAQRLGAAFGYVFDHASPIGEIVVASPTYYRLDATFRGRAAHAGIRPQDGRSAVMAAAQALTRLPHGRIDAETTANVGSVRGGVDGTNVVAERCEVALEVRSLDPARAEAVVGQCVDALHDGAAAVDCDVDVRMAKLFTGYRQKPAHPAVRAAERALAASGYEPRRIATGGGSDANALEEQGFPCVNLANGTERNHEPTERVAVAALDGMLDVALALLPAAAEVLAA